MTEIEVQDLRLVDIETMAGILGVNKNWLYRRTMLGNDAIPHYKVGRLIRFNPIRVLDFLAGNGNGSGRH